MGERADPDGVGDGEPRPIGRRAFMAGVVAAVAAASTAAACSDDGDGNGGEDDQAAPDRDRPADLDLPPVPDGLAADVFALGVASGDPRPDSVVLWTRLVTDPAAPDGAIGTRDPVPVAWEVASDEDFDDVVADGAATADGSLAHSVHVVVDDLDADRWYWYRFTVGDRTSPAGRARTSPADDDEPERLRFAFASCQNRPQGYWTAHDHLAEEDVDLVLFLGDYIYEGPPTEGAVQPYVTPAPVDLPGYRARWAEYKADPSLQAGHARCPWVCTWDDHEVANNYAADIAQGADPGDAAGRERFRAQRAAAYQAFYEHMPLRLDPPTGGRSDGDGTDGDSTEADSAEDGEAFRIHRVVDWGRLARFHVLDGRQYRSDQACGATEVLAGVGPLCDDARADGRTMLGPEQEAWLGEELAASRARWNVLAQQTVVANVPLAADVVNLDQWDGYPAARRRLLDQLAGVSNPVVITGDIHLGAAGTIESEAGEAVAVELVGTSISSDFPLADVVEPLVSGLPNVQYVNARQRGYVVCEATADGLRVDFRVVSTVLEPVADVSTAVSLLVPDGEPVLRPA